MSVGEPTDEPLGDKFDIFERWLVDNGALFPKLVLKDYGNEVRGVHSKDSILPEETIVSVPLKCLITVEMGRLTPIGKKVLASNVELVRTIIHGSNPSLLHISHT